MSSSSIRKAMEDYFKSMNSISEKLVEGIQLTCKDEGWGLFPDEEQAVIQWKKLIDPSLEDKYRLDIKEDRLVNCFPVLFVESGEKLVIDEDTSNGRPFGSSWKDEHSSPFSWETKSQLNLHLLLEESSDTTDGQPCTPKTPPSARSCKKLPTPKVTPRPSPKPSPALTRKSIKVTPEQLLLAKPKMASNQSADVPAGATAANTGKPKVEHRKKAAPPPPPPPTKQPPKEEKPKAAVVESPVPPAIPSATKEEMTAPVAPVCLEEEVQCDGDAESQSSIQMDAETPSTGIPKTGFDFLDNW